MYAHLRVFIYTVGDESVKKLDSGSFLAVNGWREEERTVEL